MKRVVLSLLLSSAALAATPPVPPTGTSPLAQAQPGPEVTLPEALRFPHPLGDAFLFRPAACTPACPLVIVSHSRGMTAEVSLTRPHLRSLYARLLGAGYAVLVSNDAGATTWGAPQALTYLADMRSRAIRTFPFNGRTYNFGYSMGGLPALLTAYLPVYPVSGVILLDAQVNLNDAWKGSNATFRADIGTAHGVSLLAPLPPRRDPAEFFTGPQATQLPVLVAGSPEDQVVSFARNGEALFSRNTSDHSRLVRLTGPHLGGSHFGDALVNEMLTFLGRLEQRVTPDQGALPRPSGEGN
ncbi:alpha/beta hydrolase [Deinococcus aestuarii]|uniref:alpha/beta hydrolase n=1 Tax=Deinococcus aestuarii TaxID=2774531 RepID=UPI001C0AAC72|nr:alpha/beta hydrolase [Deinococcus aestuarii]